MKKHIMVILISLIGFMAWGQHSEGERYYISEDTKALIYRVFPSSFANKVLAYPVTWSKSIPTGEDLSDGATRAWTDSKSYIKLNGVYNFDGLTLKTYMHEVFHSWVKIVGEPNDLRKDYSIDRIRVALLDKRLNEESECTLFSEYMVDLDSGYYNIVASAYFKKFHPALYMRF